MNNAENATFVNCQPNRDTSNPLLSNKIKELIKSAIPFYPHLFRFV